MTWHDLLFVHWPFEAATLRPLVPAALELDLHEGQAWLGVVPFRMTGVRARWTPALPWFSAFPELNVRTYVRAGGKPGVWFFSLDAANPVAVRGARWCFHLPYFDARMRCERSGEDVHYSSVRTHRGAPGAAFVARYRPAGALARAQPGSIDHWLTARYCLYAVGRAGRLFRGDIHHLPWPLEAAEAEVEVNTMASPLGVNLPAGAPLLHFARRLDVVAWSLGAL
jgi:hypothetical protein